MFGISLPREASQVCVFSLSVARGQAKCGLRVVGFLTGKEWRGEKWKDPFFRDLSNLVGSYCSRVSCGPSNELWLSSRRSLLPSFALSKVFLHSGQKLDASTNRFRYSSYLVIFARAFSSPKLETWVGANSFPQFAHFCRPLVNAR